MRNILPIQSCQSCLTQVQAQMYVTTPVPDTKNWYTDVNFHWSWQHVFWLQMSFGILDQDSPQAVSKLAVEDKVSLNHFMSQSINHDPLCRAALGFGRSAKDDDMLYTMSNTGRNNQSYTIYIFANGENQTSFNKMLEERIWYFQSYPIFVSYQPETCTV